MRLQAQTPRVGASAGRRERSETQVLIADSSAGAQRLPAGRPICRSRPCGLQRQPPGRRTDGGRPCGRCGQCSPATGRCVGLALRAPERFSSGEPTSTPRPGRPKWAGRPAVDHHRIADSAVGSWLPPDGRSCVP